MLPLINETSPIPHDSALQCSLPESQSSNEAKCTIVAQDTLINSSSEATSEATPKKFIHSDEIWNDKDALTLIFYRAMGKKFEDAKKYLPTYKTRLKTFVFLTNLKSDQTFKQHYSLINFLLSKDAPLNSIKPYLQKHIKLLEVNEFTTLDAIKNVFTALYNDPNSDFADFFIKKSDSKKTREMHSVKESSGEPCILPTPIIHKPIKTNSVLANHDTVWIEQDVLTFMVYKAVHASSSEIAGILKRTIPSINRLWHMLKYNERCKARNQALLNFMLATETSQTPLNHDLQSTLDLLLESLKTDLDAVRKTFKIIYNQNLSLIAEQTFSLPDDQISSPHDRTDSESDLEPSLGFGKRLREEDEQEEDLMPSKKQLRIDDTNSTSDAAQNSRLTDLTEINSCNINDKALTDSGVSDNPH